VRFEGKVAIITGAAGGIGSAAAALFAKDGCRVAALDINEPALEALAEKTDGLPGVVTPVLTDASSAGQARSISWSTVLVVVPSFPAPDARLRSYRLRSGRSFWISILTLPSCSAKRYCPR